MDLVTRSEWGARPARSTSPRPAYSAVVVHHTADGLDTSWRRIFGRPGPRYWTKQYAANRAVQSAIAAYKKDDKRLFDKEVKAMQSMQNFHMDDQGWADLGYHIVIFPSGRAYQGRPLNVMGAHTLGRNDYIGISFAGNFDKEKLTPQAIATYKAILAELRPSTVKGHYKYNPTACPGVNIKTTLGV